MREIHLDVTMKKQPDDVTCGPTCLHAVYHYLGANQSLSSIIEEVRMLEEGGTLAPSLGYHALIRGLKATVVSFNLNIFDPTWFQLDTKQLINKLEAQMKAKRKKKLRLAISIYRDFIQHGGRVEFADLSSDLLATFVEKGHPIIVGLSATYLYRSPREIPEDNSYDDVRGYPSGHFVVITGMNRETQEVTVADPYYPNPLTTTGTYKISSGRLICAILLGVVTYDANLLVIEKEAM